MSADFIRMAAAQAAQPAPAAAPAMPDVNGLRRSAIPARLRDTNRPHSPSPVNKGFPWKFALLGALGFLGLAGAGVAVGLGLHYNHFSADTTSLLVSSALGVSMIAGLIFMWRIENDKEVKHKFAKTLATVGILALGALIYNIVNSNTFDSGWLSDHIVKGFTENHTWQEWVVGGSIAAGAVLTMSAVYAAIYHYRKELLAGKKN